MALLRFQSTRADKASGHPEGIFVVAYEVARNWTIAPRDRDRINALLDWFQANLVVPHTTGTNANKNKRNKGSDAISWFKPEATTQLKKMWELVVLLRELGIPIETSWTDDPGYIVYEDQYQIVARPFSGSR